MLYVSRLEDLGIKKAISKKVQLLEHFPEAQQQFDGRNILIVFKKDMESMLRDALKKHDFSEDVAILAKMLQLSEMTFLITNDSNLLAAFHQDVKKILFPRA